MSYIINLTDGATLATIADGTLNTTACTMSLPGKNYAGYGIYLNENFVGKNMSINIIIWAINNLFLKIAAKIHNFKRKT